MKFLKLFDRVKAVLAILLCCVIIVFGVFGHSGVVSHFINSDTLQPANLAWEMTHHDYAIANFQWSRVPSFPDVAFFFVIEWLSVDLSTAYLIYTCLVAIAAILALGWVITRMSGSTFATGVFWSGIAVTASLLVLLAGIAVAPDREMLWIPQSYLFLANFHGNAFLLSVIASCTSLGAIRGDRRQAWLTWGLCALGTASDTIFLGYFLLPFALALAVVVLRRRGSAADATGQSAVPSGKAALRHLALAGLACSVGWAAKLPLPMQGMSVLPDAQYNWGLALRDLQQAPWIVALLVLTLLLSIRAAALLRPAPPAAPGPCAEIDRELLLLTGTAASVMSFGLAILIYLEPTANRDAIPYLSSYRYAIPFFWWPVALVLGLIRAPSRRRPGALVLAVAALATAALPLSASALPQWRTPLERCLSDHRAEWGLKAGLATYWNSRSTMASSGWQLQVDQINDSGDVYIWGNNAAAYTHDMNAPQRPPEYNFVVIDSEVDTFTLETAFGPAGRAETCGDYEVWIFDQPIVPNGLGEYKPGSFIDRILPS